LIFLINELIKIKIVFIGCEALTDFDFSHHHSKKIYFHILLEKNPATSTLREAFDFFKTSHRFFIMPATQIFFEHQRPGHHHKFMLLSRLSAQR
jgi:hypothetical protein